MSIRFTVETGLRLLIQYKPNNDKFMDHCRTVADHAAKALKYERLTPRKRLCVELAALLHDLDSRHYFTESTNNENTRALLSALISIDNLDDFIEEVVALINLIYSDIEAPQPWMYIPRDCDCLETLSTETLNRHMTLSLMSGRDLHGPCTTRAYSIQEVLTIATPDRFNNYLNGSKSDSVIDYCYDKLLHLAQPGILKSQNPYIMNEARKRVEAITQTVVSYWLSVEEA